MSENVSLADLVAYLPANARQLQARFPQLPPALIHELISRGQHHGLIVWDALSSRYKATGKGGAEQVVVPERPRRLTSKHRACETCGEEFLPTSNAQKRCDRHAERRIRGSDQVKPPAAVPAPKSGEQLPSVEPEVPSLPPQLPEQAPVSKPETLVPTLRLRPRPEIECRLEVVEGDPTFVIAADGAVVQLDFWGAAALKEWLVQGLTACKTRIY